VSLDSIIDDVLTPKQPFGAGVEPGAQGSIEWLMERCGYVTASRFKDVLDFNKTGKPSAKRTGYLWEIVIERLTGKPAQHYTSDAMQHGIQNEPLARMAYCAQTGAFVEQTGFRKHPAMPFVGGSPDGVIEPSGGLEIKSPFNPQHHLQCFLTGMPEEHTAQVQGLMWLHGAEWWDFASHCPTLPEPYQLYVQRIDRDAEYAAMLSLEINRFQGEVQDILDKLKESAT